MLNKNHKDGGNVVFKLLRFVLSLSEKISDHDWMQHALHLCSGGLFHYWLWKTIVPSLTR